MTEKYFIYCVVHQAGGYTSDISKNVCDHCDNGLIQALESKNSEYQGFDMDEIKKAITDNNLEVPQ